MQGYNVAYPTVASHCADYGDACKGATVRWHATLSLKSLNGLSTGRSVQHKELGPECTLTCDAWRKHALCLTLFLHASASNGQLPVFVQTPARKILAKVLFLYDDDDESAVVATDLQWD
jgi:hypothetical protein